jgi:hypothetical protein
MERRHPNHPGELSTERAAAECRREVGELGARAEALQLFTRSRIPVLVGGAYAFAEYTGIYRDTKDLDVFLRKRDAGAALDLLQGAGWRAERTDEGWIYKAFRDEWFVDLIFSSGNRLAQVDDSWFQGNPSCQVLGSQVRLVRPEEMIWSKAFVLERERYDGADVAHLIKAGAASLDWKRMMRHFDPHWEVLLSHLLLYRYAYPGERSQVPPAVMNELMDRVRETVRTGDVPSRICRGTLLSRYNYVLDVQKWGYEDARSERSESE